MLHTNEVCRWVGCEGDTVADIDTPYCRKHMEEHLAAKWSDVEFLRGG